MSKFINKKSLILMVSTILAGSSVVAIAAACNNKTSQPSKQKETNTQQSSSSTVKTMTEQKDKMNSMDQPQTNKQTNKQTNNTNAHTNHNHGNSTTGSNSKSENQLKTGSKTDTTKKDSPGSTSSKAMEKQDTKPPVLQSGSGGKNESSSGSAVTPKTEGSTTTGNGNKNTPTPDSSKKEEKGTANSSPDPKATPALPESEAVVDIYSGTKIMKQSGDKWSLQIPIQKANDKYAQVVLKYKGGQEVSSTFGKIITNYVSVNFDKIEEDKDYEVVLVKISDSTDGLNPKAAKLSESTKKIKLKYTEDRGIFG